MMQAARGLTETQLLAIRRREAFAASIEQKAAALKEPKPAPLISLSPACVAVEPEAEPVEAAPVEVAPVQAPKASSYCPHCAGDLSVQPYALTIRRIKFATARAFVVNPGDLDSPRRQADIVQARHVAMWLVKELIPLKSYPGIGRSFGGRDHTTALHACRSMPGKLRRDPLLAHVVADLLVDLTERPHD